MHDACREILQLENRRFRTIEQTVIYNCTNVTPCSLKVDVLQ